MEKGQDFIFEKFEELLKKYDEGELDETFIDIFCNLYTADYIKFAKVNEDGSFDTVFETDYNSVPLEKNTREWICLTDDEELLAKGKSTVTINDDWTIYYKTCDETGSFDYNDRNRNYYFGNSWNAAELSNYGRGQALFVACIISSGALQYRIPVIETYYEDQNTFHIGKVHLEDYDYRRYSSEQSWDFTDPSKADLYSTNVYDENTDFGDMYCLFFRCDRPDAFFGQNGDIFLANSMSNLEKFDRETDGRIRKQYGEIFSARAGMRNNGYYTMGRLAVIDIKGDAEYMTERDYFNTALFCLVDNAVKYGNKDAKIEAAITSKSITIRNKTTAGKYTPGTGIAIAGRIFEQHKLKLTTDLKDVVFEARITKK